MSELQRIVDSLASRVGRPALIEDRRQRVVVYSEQTEPMDEVRRLSILRRQTTPEVIAFFRRAGISAARQPIRTPACPELDMLPRVCVPVWHRDLLLGFVWFIDPDRSMSDDEIAALSTTTLDLALALYRENLAGELATQRETEAVRMLLADEPEARRHGALTLLEDGALAGDGPTTAVLARLVPPPAGRLDDLARVALEQALLATRRWVGPRDAVHLVRYDHGVLLLRAGDGRLPDTGRRRERPARAAADHLNAGLTAAVRTLPAVASAVVGVGQPQPELAAARASYEQAALAAKVAVQLPAVGPVAVWAQLGVYRVLSQLSGDEVRTASVHPGLERLLDDPASRALLETLEAYLDLAGNAQATALRLNLHRTSLYYRLQRVERLAGADLRSGDDRLALHLALKLARLTGRYAPGGVRLPDTGSETSSPVAWSSDI